jgi:predicted MPP superfamily phosphohydrolase
VLSFAVRDNDEKRDRSMPIRTFLAIAMAILFAPSATKNLASGAEPKPLFRFAQVNDLHVQATEPPVRSEQQQTYKSANEKARWVVEAINGTLLPPCDFVVGVGDLIHGEALERIRPDLKTFQEIIAPLRCPFYPVVGNHEVVQQERSSQYLQPYRDAFGRDHSDYTFTHGGILFVALNNSGAPSAQAANERNQWLREALAAGKGQPKIILCHIPLIPLRDEATLAQSFGFTSYRDHDPGSLQLIEEHHDSVIAVLSGHLHLTGMKRRSEIFHISVAGTASYPCDIAVYEVFPDRIEVAVKQLPQRLANAETSIHGKGQHGRDFTDSEHPTAEEYQSGRADERQFTIRLTGGKRPQTP